MAYTGDTLSAISSALSTTFSSRLARQWNRSAVLAKMLPMEPAVGAGGGKQVAWDVEFTGATAASFAEGEDIASGEFAVDVLKPAVLPFGQYRSAFQLSNLEINAAAASISNASALGQLMVERLDGSLAKMASVANADLFAGDGTDVSSNPTIIGLDTALAATGSYAGLAKGTYTEWAGNVLANGAVARPLTMDLLYNLEQLIFTASGMEPDVLVVSPGVYRKYAGLFEATRRVVSDGRGPIANYQGAASDLFWKGKPVIRDRNATAGTVYMLNTSELAVRPLPFSAGDMDGIGSMAAVPSSNGEAAAPTGLSCMVYPLGRTGSSVKFVAEMYLQLQVKRVNAHGICSDVSEV